MWGRRGVRGGRGWGGDADYSAGVEQDWLLSHSRASQVTPRTVLFLPRTDASPGT